MKKEHLLILIAGFFLLAYLLDAVVNPLSLQLATPYQYFNPKTLTTYPFTTVSIILKAIAIFLLPLLAFSILTIPSLTKGVTSLILSALLQLYALQDIASASLVVPLEWSLAFTLSGLILIIPTILFLLQGLFNSLHQKLFNMPFNPPSIAEDKDKQEKLHRLNQDS